MPDHNTEKQSEQAKQTIKRNNPRDIHSNIRMDWGMNPNLWVILGARTKN